MRFAIFLPHLSKVLRLPRKSDARSYEVLHLSRKIIFPKLKIWCSNMQPFSGNQRPDLLTSLMNMSLVLRLPREMHLSRSSSNVLRNYTKPSRFAHFWPGAQSLAPAMQNTTSEPSKVVRACGAFSILTWKCASRHNGLHFFDISTSKKVVRACGVFSILTWKCASRQNGVHFFDISTSKTAPRPRCFVPFHLEMRFAPQRRAIFHLSSGQLAPHPPL